MKYMRTYKIILNCFLVLILFISCKNEPKETKEKNEDAVFVEELNTESETDKTLHTQFKIEPDLSTIYWTGSKPAGEHKGKLKVKSGEIIFNNDTLVSGKFSIDMNSISVLDLTGEEKKDLENHLKGNIQGKEDHFFNVKKYPEALFIIKSASKKIGFYSIYGELIMKGISNSIKFKATINFSRDFNTMKLTTENFEIDRTKWGIEYKSKSIFDDLKERFIYDEIGLQVILKATRE